MQPLKPARSDGRRALRLQRPASASRVVNWSSVAKSCAARPMRRSGGSRPNCARIGRESHGSVLAARGPGAFVQSAEDDEVEALQPRFQRPQDRKPRMLSIARPHGAFFRQGAEQHRIGAAFDLRQAGVRPPEIASTSCAAASPASPRHRRASPDSISLAASASAQARCAAKNGVGSFDAHLPSTQFRAAARSRRAALNQ